LVTFFVGSTFSDTLLEERYRDEQTRKER